MSIKQSRKCVTLVSIAEKMGVSKQAVSQFLKRKDVQPIHGGNGPCTHFYDPEAVEAAYGEKRWYRHC